ncbi:MAG: S8 family serine peptidase, partial [Candidatus Poseidoniales archaeon]|nr:S8 family serine peptidase [Candidatus Poseidoniales archaeon]
QIGSFSFGYSSVVDAGSDQNSVYLDWLTRVYSKNTTYLVALGNGGHGYGTVASPGGAAGIISVGAFSSRTGESAGATWGESASWSNRGPNSQGRMDPDLVTIGWSATGDVTLNEKTDANSAYRSWSGTSLSTPVAAGLMALLYQAWMDEHGTFPNSQEIRDLAMSTASDRANDPNVQGGGWFDADRATATIAGESGTWWTQPASWMPGENAGQHRDANINWLLPGDSSDLNLSFNNPSQDNFWIDTNATLWEPASHDVFVWNSSETGDWDGYQSSRPDIVIPILIHGDDNNTTIANDSTLVRARATIDARGFDGNQNYQSENRPYLRIYRWNDTDGDGKWWSDDDGDGHVDSGEWESANEYSVITEHMYASPQVEARIGDPWAQPADGLLLGIFRENKQTSQADPLPMEIDITSFRKVHDSWLNPAPPAFILPNSTTTIPLTINVPNDATPGLR